MAVEYDLVVIGGTQEGLEAAGYAAQQGARVALVLQGQSGRRSPLQTRGGLGITQAAHPQTVTDAGQTPLLPPWPWLSERATLIADLLSQEDLQHLMVQGVDVIAEAGQMIGDRPLQIKTPSRHLTSRALLIATGCRPPLPPISGLASVPYETPAAFLRRQTLPSSVVVLGTAPLALALCQRLCRLSVPITLVTEAPALLTQEDADVSRWIAAQLRADGVDLRLGTVVTQVAQTPAGIALQHHDGAVTVAALVVGAAPAPNLGEIQIDRWVAMGRHDAPTVNAHLQTSHPRIYACGAVLSGHDLPAIARQEAQIAVDNALFWNRRSIDYGTIPYGLLTQPGMARVGLTEHQARRRYRENQLLVCRQSLYETPKAQWLESVTGFCKIIAHRNGSILGVHGVGSAADEWIQTMALLMAQKTPWWAVARSPILPYTLTDILRQATQHWERDRWQPGQWRRDWAENWFNWRRSR